MGELGRIWVSAQIFWSCFLADTEFFRSTKSPCINNAQGYAGFSTQKSSQFVVEVGVGLRSEKAFQPVLKQITLYKAPVPESSVMGH